MSDSTTLVEQSTDWRSEARVDRSERLVRNVALAGPASRNGYRYLDSALRDGAALYDGKPVFLDHARDARRPQERSTRDLVGSIVQPRFEGGRIRGDIAVLDTEAGQTFLSLVESDAPGVGMSHVVLAERGGESGAIVERIRDVISVDAVIGPATTMTFRESVSDAGPAGEEPGSAVCVEVDTSAQQGELESLLRERDALAERVTFLEQQRSAVERRADIQQLLASSKLPSYAVTPLFVEQLATAEDGLREKLITERRELIARTRPRASVERLSAGRGGVGIENGVCRGDSGLAIGEWAAAVNRRRATLPKDQMTGG